MNFFNLLMGYLQKMNQNIIYLIINLYFSLNYNRISKFQLMILFHRLIKLSDNSQYTLIFLKKIFNHIKNILNLYYLYLYRNLLIYAFSEYLNSIII